MKIITVNIPVSHIKMIDSLVGETGLYPSRSELIRVALRDFLIKQLEESFECENNDKESIVVTEHSDDSMYIRVPYEKNIGMNTVTEYKTYRIIRK